MSARRYRELLRRCAATVAAEIDVPTSFDIDQFCQRLQQRRARPLHRVPIVAPPGSPCGMWVALAGSDYIFHDVGTTPLHTEHIVLHEIGHMVLAHQGAAPLDESLLAQLMPSLNPQRVRHVLGRAAYSAEEEQEAEIFASLVLERARRHPSSASESQVPADVEPALQRIETTFGK